MDAEGINQLLREYRLAEGAHILVSEGKVCIPFEDGEEMTESQRRVEAREQINRLKRQIEPMLHSQKVLAVLHAELMDKFQGAMADFKSEPNNKKYEAIKNEINDALVQNESQRRHNEHEIRRIEVNIEIYENSAGLYHVDEMPSGEVK